MYVHYKNNVMIWLFHDVNVIFKMTFISVVDKSFLSAEYTFTYFKVILHIFMEYISTHFQLGDTTNGNYLSVGFLFNVITWAFIHLI